MTETTKTHVPAHLSTFGDEPNSTTRRTRRAGRAIAGFAGVAVSATFLAGCATSAPEATAPVTVTESAAPAAPNTESSDTGSAATSEPTATDAGATEGCGFMPDDPRITEAIAEVPSPFADPSQQDVAWSEQIVDTNYDPCADLSFATITAEGGTGSSPMQVMLFGRGEYIGTTSDCAPANQTVEQNDADSVTVTYEWPKDGEANGGAKDSAQVQYSLVNGEISMSNPLPDGAINEQICHTWPPKQ